MVNEDTPTTRLNALARLGSLVPKEELAWSYYWPEGARVPRFVPEK
jgi:hypothetical protein